ncbi:hypothetical protein [Nitratireductor sp. GCM10026969]|uniref:hypothetical protein n=1 Tax=Nitratireductor sp. GCM10026969 TaxID=3252645 RepID=UPI0036098A26
MKKVSYVLLYAVSVSEIFLEIYILSLRVDIGGFLAAYLLLSFLPYAVCIIAGHLSKPVIALFAAAAVLAHNVIAFRDFVSAASSLPAGSDVFLDMLLFLLIHVPVLNLFILVPAAMFIGWLGDGSAQEVEAGIERWRRRQAGEESPAD